MIQKCSELRSFRHGKDKISLLYNLGVNLWGSFWCIVIGKIDFSVFFFLVEKGLSFEFRICSCSRYDNHKSTSSSNLTGMCS